MVPMLRSAGDATSPAAIANRGARSLIKGDSAIAEAEVVAPILRPPSGFGSIKFRPNEVISTTYLVRCVLMSFLKRESRSVPPAIVMASPWY